MFSVDYFKVKLQTLTLFVDYQLFLSIVVSLVHQNGNP